MKKLLLLTKTILVAALLGVASNAWGQDMNRTDGTGLTFFFSGYGSYTVGGSVSIGGGAAYYGNGINIYADGRYVKCTLNTALQVGDVIYLYRTGNSKNTITICNDESKTTTWYTSSSVKSGEHTFTVTESEAGATSFCIFGNGGVLLQNVEVRRDGASINLIDYLSSDANEVINFESLTGTETYTSNTAVGKVHVMASASHTVSVYNGDVVTSGKNSVDGTSCTNALDIPTGAGFIVRLPSGIGRLTVYYDTNSQNGSCNSKYQYDQLNSSGRGSESMYPGTLTIVNNCSYPRVFYLYVDNTYSRNLHVYGLKWEPNFPVTGTITTCGWSTFASPYPLDLSTISGGTAYYASAASGSTVTLTSTDATVPKGEGIMVKGTAGETFTINVAASGTAIDGNLLKGQTTTGNVAASTDGTNHYVFGFESASKYGFYNLTEATSVVAGKAYLETTTALTQGGARLAIVFDDEATGISEATLNNKEEIIKDNIFFNLQGQRVDNPKKGLYIVNGKKIIIK